VYVSAANSDALQELASVLVEVDKLRSSVQGPGDADRAREVIAAEPIQTQLIKPVFDCLAQTDLRPAEVDLFKDMISTALAALTDNDLISLSMSFEGQP
jgi:hypothetical protein